MNDTCPLYNPDGACKCRICKPVYSIDMDKEYTMVQRMMRLADLYRKFVVTKLICFSTNYMYN